MLDGVMDKISPWQVFEQLDISRCCLLGHGGPNLTLAALAFLLGYKKGKNKGKSQISHTFEGYLARKLHASQKKDGMYV